MFQNFPKDGLFKLVVLALCAVAAFFLARKADYIEGMIRTWTNRSRRCTAEKPESAYKHDDMQTSLSYDEVDEARDAEREREREIADTEEREEAEEEKPCTAVVTAPRKRTRKAKGSSNTTQ